MQKELVRYPDLDIWSEVDFMEPSAGEDNFGVLINRAKSDSDKRQLSDARVLSESQKSSCSKGREIFGRGIRETALSDKAESM